MPDETAPPLKPCPFCGGQPRYTERECTPSERSPTGRIYFLACMCGGHSARAHQFGYSREEVAEAWNRRMPHPDARRLDLVERHRLLVAPSISADRWIASEHFPPGVSRHGATAREAIDAAAMALGGDEAE